MGMPTSSGSTLAPLVWGARAWNPPHRGHTHPIRRAPRPSARVFLMYAARTSAVRTPHTMQVSSGRSSPMGMPTTGQVGGPGPDGHSEPGPFSLPGVCYMRRIGKKSAGGRDGGNLPRFPRAFGPPPPR